MFLGSITRMSWHTQKHLLKADTVSFEVFSLTDKFIVSLVYLYISIRCRFHTHKSSSNLGARIASRLYFSNVRQQQPAFVRGHICSVPKHAPYTYILNLRFRKNWIGTTIVLYFSWPRCTYIIQTLFLNVPHQPDSFVRGHICYFPKHTLYAYILNLRFQKIRIGTTIVLCFSIPTFLGNLCISTEKLNSHDRMYEYMFCSWESKMS
jgi:hypothetical protein